MEAFGFYSSSHHCTSMETWPLKRLQINQISQQKHYKLKKHTIAIRRAKHILAELQLCGLGPQHVWAPQSECPLDVPGFMDELDWQKHVEY